MAQVIKVTTFDRTYMLPDRVLERDPELFEIVKTTDGKLEMFGVEVEKRLIPKEELLIEFEDDEEEEEKKEMPKSIHSCRVLYKKLMWARWYVATCSKEYKSMKEARDEFELNLIDYAREKQLGKTGFNVLQFVEELKHHINIKKALKTISVLTEQDQYMLFEWIINYLNDFEFKKK